MYFIKKYAALLPELFKKTENINSKIFKTKNGRLLKKILTVELKSSDL